MDLVEFIGLKHILMKDGDESVIDEIADEISWNHLKEVQINTFRSKRNNGSNVCTFRKFLSNQTMNFLNAQIIKTHLDKYLIGEWNKICPFDDDVLSHYNVSH